MANPIVEIWLKLRDEVSSGLNDVQKSLIKFGDEARTAASKWGAATAAIGAATAGLVMTFKEFIRASNESEVAQIRLMSAMRSVGQGSPEVVKRLTDQASALQELTGTSDEAVMGAQALLAQFKLNDAQILAMTPRILDFAAATGTDVQTAAFVAGRAINFGAESLKRYGISLTEAQIKSFNAASEMDRIAMLSDILAQKFPGVAAALGETFMGRMGALKGALGDIEESAGSLIKTALTPIVSIIASVVNWFNRLSPAVRGTAIALGLLMAVFVTLVPLAGLIYGLWPLLTAAFSAAVAPMALLAAEIVAVAAGLAVIGVTIAGTVKGGMEALRTFARNVLNIFSDVGAAAHAFAELMQAAIHMDAAKAKKGWADLKLAALNGVADLAGAVIDPLKIIRDNAVNVATDMAKSIAAAIAKASTGTPEVPGGPGTAPQQMPHLMATEEEKAALQQSLLQVEAMHQMSAAHILEIWGQAQGDMTTLELTAAQIRIAAAQREWSIRTALANSLVDTVRATGQKMVDFSFAAGQRLLANEKERASQSAVTGKQIAHDTILTIGQTMASSIMASSAAAAALAMGPPPMGLGPIAGIPLAIATLAKGAALAAAVSAATGAAAGSFHSLSGGGAPAQTGPGGAGDFTSAPAPVAISGGSIAGGPPEQGRGSVTINISVDPKSTEEQARMIGRAVHDEISLWSSS